jgi:protein tyrosine phosphatase
MIMFVVSIGLLAFALMAVLAILIYTKLTTNESWSSVLRFWNKPSISSSLFKGGKYGKDRLTLLNHISSSYEDEDESDDGPVNLDNFTEISIERHSNPVRVDRLFSYFCEAIIAHRLKEEFVQIPKGQLRHWNVARLPINRNKHRYNSLMAYDYNRVVLREFENERFAPSSSNELETNLDFERQTQASDYINASYVDGPLGKRRFVATQGPLIGTFGDFWKMIWQTCAVQIVMLTNVQEMGKMKCDKYWPELQESVSYGQLTCTLQEEQVCADYTVRLIRVCLNSKSYESREILQYHFTAWPDHSVPVYSDAIPLLLHRIRALPTFVAVNPTKRADELPEYSHPVVVHCSAGIGRTGTLMLISNILDSYGACKKDAEPRVDILKEFCAMRAQRINLIERISQYVFVHRVLVEMLARKDLLDLNANDFANHYRQVKSDRGRTDKSLRIDVQFKSLQKFRNQIDKDACSVGHFHFKRNRNKDAIPGMTSLSF